MPHRGIWQCPETFLIVTMWGRKGAEGPSGKQQAEAKDTVTHPTRKAQNIPHDKGLPDPRCQQREVEKPCSGHTLFSRGTLPLLLPLIIPRRSSGPHSDFASCRKSSWPTPLPSLGQPMRPAPSPSRTCAPHWTASLSRRPCSTGPGTWENRKIMSQMNV